MQELTTYRPSGVIGTRAVLVTTGMGLPLAAALGYGLAWAQSLAHGAIASSICALLAALVVGVVFATVADHARSRHVLANTWGAILLLTCLLLVRWWCAESLPGEARWALVVSALFEAFMVGALVLILCRAQARKPFSELIQQWAASDMEGELWGDSASAGQVLAGLQEHGVSLLLSMPRTVELGASAASQWRTVAVQGHWVEADLPSRWLTIKVKTHERGDDGKIKTQSEDLVEHWTVSADDYLAVKRLLAGAARPTTAPKVESQVEPGARPTPTVLQPAVTALEAEQFSVCMSLAQEHCQHPDPEIRADAWRLCALAQANLKHWPQAFDQYHHLFELEPTTFNAVQLATTSVMAGELTRGEAWFAKAVELNDETPKMPPARMRTAYLSSLEQAGEFEAAQPHLDWLAQGYMAMGITDDHFVWTRGFPFFSEFLSRSHRLLTQVLGGPDLRAWYERMTESLDDEGRQKLIQHLGELPGAGAGTVAA